jgi:membrane-associated phospholipid phosphatase
VRKILTGLETADLLVFGYSAFMALLIGVFFARIPGAAAILAAHAGVTAAAALLVWGGGRFPGRGWRIARDWYPFATLPFAFRELHYLVHPVNPADWDFTLMAWDRALFGTAPTVALEGWLHPLAVEFFMLCYTTYYFLPVILGIVLYAQRRPEAFREGLALILMGFFTSYLGYFVIPAFSPHVKELALGHPRAWGAIPEAQGYGLAPLLRETILALELEMRDAFPSGHTEVTLVTLAYAWRFSRPVFWSILVPGTGLILATVYLRLHYAVDVLAGAVLAALVLGAGPALHRGWEAWRKRGGAAGGDREAPG